MTDSGRRIDHVVIAVKNLDAMAAQYEQAGFTLTPRARHEDRMGTSNRLVQLHDKSFIEILEVDRPDTLVPHQLSSAPPHFSFGEHNRQFLETREGMSMLAFATSDALADIVSIDAAGIQTYAPFDFERKATLPDGNSVTVSFSLGFATSTDMPESAYFVCQNRAPEYFWKPQFQKHNNKVTGLNTVYLCSDNPQRDVEFLNKLFNGDQRSTDSGYEVQCGNGHRIVVIDYSSLQKIDATCDLGFDNGPFFAGLDLATHPSEPSQDMSLIPFSAGLGIFLRLL